MAVDFFIVRSISSIQILYHFKCNISDKQTCCSHSFSAMYMQEGQKQVLTDQQISCVTEHCLMSDGANADNERVSFDTGCIEAKQQGTGYEHTGCLRCQLSLYHTGVVQNTTSTLRLGWSFLFAFTLYNNTCMLAYIYYVAIRTLEASYIMCILENVLSDAARILKCKVIIICFRIL